MDKSESADQGPMESLEELQERFKKLEQKKYHAEADLSHARKRLSELQQEAMDAYGTDNVEELKKKLSEMKAENERKRADYHEHLEKIESDLTAVEEQFTGEELEEKGDD